MEYISFSTGFYDAEYHVDENVLFRLKSKIRCFRKERKTVALWEKLFFMVKTAFQQRRKTMRNSLKQ
jgi:16S rRNA A1518/A1519 N6-dimethyltransferase RsmA/KsgA/DIM1 with predicted DNA glycosylase/AP lyase activity